MLFLEKVNLTQSEIAGELKRPSDDGAKAAKSAYLVSVVTLLVVVISFVSQIIATLSSPNPAIEIARTNKILKRGVLSFEKLNMHIEKHSGTTAVLQQLGHEIEILQRSHEQTAEAVREIVSDKRGTVPGEKAKNEKFNKRMNR